MLHFWGQDQFLTAKKGRQVLLSWPQLFSTSKSLTQVQIKIHKCKTAVWLLKREFWRELQNLSCLDCLGDLPPCTILCRYLTAITQRTKTGRVICGVTGVSSVLRVEISYPEDGGNGLLQNVGNFLPDYQLSHPRRQWFSQSLPQEPQLPQF
jgi:hypothetical protein